MKATGKIDPKAQEHESRRIGLQDRLKERVKDAVEDPACVKRAKQQRFDATGEPSEAPTA